MIPADDEVALFYLCKPRASGDDPQVGDGVDPLAP